MQILTVYFLQASNSIWCRDIRYAGIPTSTPLNQEDSDSDCDAEEFALLAVSSSNWVDCMDAIGDPMNDDILTIPEVNKKHQNK